MKRNTEGASLDYWPCLFNANLSILLCIGNNRRCYRKVGTVEHFSRDCFKFCHHAALPFRSNFQTKK